MEKVFFCFSLLCILFLSSNSLAGEWVITELKSDFYPADGTIDAVVYWSYDENAAQKMTEHDDDNDGVIDKIVYYEWSISGQLTKSESDNDMDGDIDSFKYWTCDSNGYQIESIDSDGTIEYYTNDTDGNHLIIATDIDGNGAVDSVSYCTYNEYNYLIKEEVDSDNSGDVDSVSYDSPNDTLWPAYQEFDNDNDGTIDYSIQYYYTYDDNGNVSIQTMYFDIIGFASDEPEILYWTWEYFEGSDGSDVTVDDSSDDETSGDDSSDGDSSDGGGGGGCFISNLF